MLNQSTSLALHLLLVFRYYGSEAYPKYGGDAGRQVPGQGEAANESSPLLREDTESVWFVIMDARSPVHQSQLIVV